MEWGVDIPPMVTVHYSMTAKKLSIYIPAKDLEYIRKHCERSGIPFSTFIYKSAVHMVSSLQGTKPEIKCSYCSSMSVGQFVVEVYDNQAGMSEVSKYLCKLHLGVARGEGTVREVKEV